MKGSVIPKKWTTAKVRVNPQGKVQIALPPSAARNPGLRTKRNESISQGFWRDGIFHPIRAADDYDPEAVGEGHAYAKAKKRKKAKGRKR